MSQIRYYSMRRLAPYQGTVQVMEMPGFRAISTDGVTWRVQFLNQRSRFVSYALWRADGSGNLIDTHRTGELIRALQNHPSLPFPPADNLELWLLDARRHRPLTIVASTPGHIAPPRAMNIPWQAAFAGDDGFTAPSLSLGVDGEASTSHIPHHEILLRCVQKAAGPLDRAQWFRRERDGSGAGLHGNRLDAVHIGRKLEPEAFPELLLRETWEDEREMNLVHDYHDWHAPRLLTHHNLSRATRDRLERAACRQAGQLYPLRHVLPEIINRDLLNVAFVEAVIRRSTQADPP